MGSQTVHITKLMYGQSGRVEFYSGLCILFLSVSAFSKPSISFTPTTTLWDRLEISLSLYFEVGGSHVHREAAIQECWQLQTRATNVDNMDNEYRRYFSLKR